MGRTRWFAVLVGLGLAMAAPLAWAQGSARPQATLQCPVCDVAGSWVGNSPPLPGRYSIPLLVKESVAPTDPSRRWFTAAVQPQNGDATLGGLFPDVDQIPDAVGTYVRSGHRSYRFTWSSHLVKSPAPGTFDRSEVVYFWTFSGTVECVDANTRRLTGLLAFYSNVDRPDLVVPPLGIDGVHDQDKDDDGFADEGEVPFFAATDFEFTLKRLLPKK